MAQVCCIICGKRLTGAHDELDPGWRCQYRAIYRKGTNVKITGVGLDVGLIATLPNHSSNEWHTPGHTQITLELNQYCSRQHPHGFALHDSCWHLLVEAFEPSHVPLRRLLEVCESLPFVAENTRLFWGHTYGGLLMTDIQNTFRWEETYEASGEYSEVYCIGKKDPLHVPQIAMLPSVKQTCPFVEPFAKKSRDCFASLPQETRDAIAKLLSTRDALNLRLASASFLSIYSNSSFWASRFHPDAEMGFLFEVKGPRTYSEWIKLRRPVLRAIRDVMPRATRLKNRMRVWRIARYVVHVCNRFRVESPISNFNVIQTGSTVSMVLGHVNPDPESEQSEAQNETELNDTELSDTEMSDTETSDTEMSEAEQSEAEEDEAEPGHNKWFSEGCRVFETLEIAIPRKLKQIAVTKVQVERRFFLTGLRFISAEDADRKVGYVVEQEESVHEINSLYGLRIALSKIGIQGLQLIGQGDESSRWIGDRKGMLVCDRLVRSEPIHRLVVSYDGFKIVGLGLDIESDNTTSIHQVQALPRPELWYPRVPPQRSYVNNSVICTSQFALADFQPYITLQFGGPEGEYLPYLRAVSVQYENGLQNIEFHYNQNCGISPLQMLTRRTRRRTSLFDVDGMSGERITDIAIGTCGIDNGSPPPEAIRFIQIATNRNRSRRFFCAERDPSYEASHLDVADGTTITGIYAHYDQTLGIYGLGLISQAVEEF